MNLGAAIFEINSALKLSRLRGLALLITPAAVVQNGFFVMPLGNSAAKRVEIGNGDGILGIFGNGIDGIGVGIRGCGDGDEDGFNSFKTRLVLEGVASLDVMLETGELEGKMVVVVGVFEILDSHRLTSGW